MERTPFVSVVMGSASDLANCSQLVHDLGMFGINSELRVGSAHKNSPWVVNGIMPYTGRLAQGEEHIGYIACAGGQNALAPSIGAQSPLFVSGYFIGKNSGKAEKFDFKSAYGSPSGVAFAPAITRENALMQTAKVAGRKYRKAREALLSRLDYPDANLMPEQADLCVIVGSYHGDKELEPIVKGLEKFSIPHEIEVAVPGDTQYTYNERVREKYKNTSAVFVTLDAPSFDTYRAFFDFNTPNVVIAHVPADYAEDAYRALTKNNGVMPVASAGNIGFLAAKTIGMTSSSVRSRLEEVQKGIREDMIKSDRYTRRLSPQAYGEIRSRVADPEFLGIAISGKHCVPIHSTYLEQALPEYEFVRVGMPDMDLETAVGMAVNAKNDGKIPILEFINDSMGQMERLPTDRFYPIDLDKLAALSSKDEERSLK